MMRRVLTGLWVVLYAIALCSPGRAVALAPISDEPDSTLASRPAFVGQKSNPDRTPWVLASAAGLLAGVGVGVWLKAEADERFDSYKRTADPQRASEWFESSQRYDRASLIGWGVAQVSFVALFYLLTRETDRPLVPVEGQPLLRTGADRMEVGWSWHP